MSTVTGGKVWEPTTYSPLSPQAYSPPSWYSIRSNIGFGIISAFCGGLLYFMNYIITSVHNALSNGSQAESYTGGPMTLEMFEQDNSSNIITSLGIIHFICALVWFFAALMVICAALFANRKPGTKIFSLKSPWLLRIPLMVIIAAAVFNNSTTLEKLEHADENVVSVVQQWAEKTYGYTKIGTMDSETSTAEVTLQDGTTKTVGVVFIDGQFLLHENAEQLKAQMDKIAAAK